MQVIDSIAGLRALTHQWKCDSNSVGFVPTMGNLHEGHLTLVKRAKTHNHKVVVSIFVNPMQFGQNEDLDAYPRTIEADKQKLLDAGADAVFLPSVADMYPRGLSQQTYVEVPGISDILCGASRPGHFRGVATVVAKLFNMVRPDDAFFGEKDFQQLQVIRLMAEDLSTGITIHGVPTQRSDSGLALSSRNGYLSDEQRTTAATIYASMQYAKQAIESGERDYPALEKLLQEKLTQAGFRKDYIHIVNANTFQAASADDTHLVILVAAYLGTTRLIDNLQVHL
jgi:pantoate--beta-alanine ligase